ncbi:MAG: alkaline phosphatase family protein [Kofleriaceae bacterium]
MRACLIALLLAAACGTTTKIATLVVTGDEVELRKGAKGDAERAPGAPPILFLAFDGVSRDLLYDLLRSGKLPNMTALLGGDRLAHAYLDGSFLSNLPSTTMPAWTTMLTGRSPAEHGVTGNEYFIRESQTFACPAPVSFTDAQPTLEIYTDQYLNKLVNGSTVYERIHDQAPGALIWVVMSHVFRGADKLLLAKRGVMVKAFEDFVETELAKVSGKTSRRVYEDLDTAAIDALVTHLHAGPVPDVLTLYLSGADLYAHVAQEGPDEARRTYLVEVVDPQLASLVAALRARDALLDRWIIVSADHGHTQVVHSEENAIGTGEEDLPGVLHKVGFRTRPFRRNVDKKDPFSAVLAYGGAMAYVYLADRSTCPGEHDVCSWLDPPRYREDVLAVAEGLHQNNLDGSLAPGMKGALDMILVREPKPFAERDLPFEVYVGDGKTMSVEAYLAAHPHPTYVDTAPRLRELAAGTRGERAGDLLLIAHNGDRARPEERFYFAAPYRSWHGSPSRRDSEIPLIVAHPHRKAAVIGSWVRKILEDHPYQRKITELILGLRAGAL